MTGDLRPQSDTIFKKLLRKPSAVAGLCIIGITCLLALFAYLLAPDDTPYANRMVIELGARQPGFSKQLLFIPASTQAGQQQHFFTWLHGWSSGFRAIPINSYRFEGEKLVAAHYIDEGIADTVTFAMQQLLPKDKQALPAEKQQAYLEQNQIKERTFWLGTDRYGRDILSRLLVGARVSIAVGLVAVLLSISIGIILGALAGYFGGVIDDIIMWLINILWAIPTLLLVFAITLTIGKGFWEIFIAIGLTMWVSAARLIRGQVLVLREMEYITAAKALGLSDIRIIFRHILPNIAGPLMVIAASNFAAAILIEAGLSFLGIGVQPPQPSWGLMIKEHYNFILTNRPLLAIIPGIAIMLLVYAFNVLGNALRDVLDVREQ
ncbi:MAG: peptide transporter [Bacteroidetes bacterium 46-16]|nr:MAG: peptide transporter [Bacteroidetes bacterium 46-16]